VISGEEGNFSRNTQGGEG